MQSTELNNRKKPKFLEPTCNKQPPQVGRYSVRILAQCPSWPKLTRMKQISSRSFNASQLHHTSKITTLSTYQPYPFQSLAHGSARRRLQQGSVTALLHLRCDHTSTPWRIGRVPERERVLQACSLQAHASSSRRERGSYGGRHDREMLLGC